MHILINDPRINNTVKLQMFRRDVLNGARTQQNIVKGKTNARDWMNNIVFLTKTRSDIIEYFMKDNPAMLEAGFDNYYLSCNERSLYEVND